MDAREQAVFVLKMILAVGPLAFYFLVLGLINSQARPRMVRARTDFVLLASAFVPLLIMPLLALIQGGHWGWVAGGLAGMITLFFSLLPPRDHSRVVYNCSPAQARRLLTQAAGQLGWRLERISPQQFLTHPGKLKLTFSTLPWLRSLTLHIEPLDASEAAGTERSIHRLLVQLRAEMDREAMLPSPAGASLVIVGAILLGLPMWYLFHHMEAIVEAVRRIFFA